MRGTKVRYVPNPEPPPPPVPGPRMRTAGSKRTGAYKDEHLYPGRARPAFTYRGERRTAAKEMARRMGSTLKEIWKMLNS